MDNAYIKNNLETIFENFKDMIKVETVVGEAVHIGDCILVPFVDISFGFGTGGLNGKTETGRQSAGGGGGAKWSRQQSSSSRAIALKCFPSKKTAIRHRHSKNS